MTAHELANLLLEGPDLMVTVSGYEGGVTEIEGIDPPQSIHLNAHLTEWYYGDHEYCDEHLYCPFCEDAPKHELSSAIHIG